MSTIRENYIVYIRSMTTYDDHEFGNLQERRKAAVLNVIAIFNTFEVAQKYILRKGKSLTESFNELNDEPCVFFIVKQKNLEDSDELEDILSNISLYYNTQDRFPTYAFSEDAYKMLSDEHFIFASHDWASLIPQKIAYVNNESITYGFKYEDLIRAINIPNRNYRNLENKLEDEFLINEYSNLSQEEKKIQFES